MQIINKTSITQRPLEFRIPWGKIHRKMYNSGHHQNQQSASHFNSATAGPSNQTGNSGSSAGLPPLLLNARLHELVIAGTGQNERLEPALEHVNLNWY